MKYTFVAASNSSVKEFLNRYLPLNKEKIDRLITKGEIKINGVRALKNSVIENGDVVSAFVPETFGVARPEIIYNDDNILIVDKPVGYEIETSLKFYLEQTYGILFPVHRLDRNTTGLVIFAKNKTAEEELNTAIKNRMIKKFYLAWLKGVLEKEEGELVAYLIKEDSGVKIVAKPTKNAKKIVTRYKTLKTMSDRTLAEIELVTGRTHQIRAHFAFIGHAVIGDNRYSDGNGYQKLRAYKIIFEGLNKLGYLNDRSFEAESKSFYDSDKSNN